MKLFRRGTDAAPGNGTEGAPAPRAWNNLLPALVVAVGLVVSAFLFTTRSAATPATAAAAAAHEPAATEAATHGPVQNLEPITLNLADGHFLKVGLALQLAEVEGHAGEELPSAKALDIAISHLRSHTVKDLSSAKGLELVKNKLTEQVADAYVDPETHEPLVTKVYFTEFVMQ